MKTKISLFLFIFISQIISQNQPYVILISFDGFRWDYSERGISPYIEKMKNEGVQAISLKPSFPTKTFPNHYSIVTGMYPENHGILFNHFRNPFTNVEFSISDTAEVRNSEWYSGEAFWETAERNGIKSGCYFWPGSEINIKKRRPSYYKKYNHYEPYKDRIDGVIKWLKLPEERRPRFITIYFHDADSYGHDYGPKSAEINLSIKRLDSLLGYLFEELGNINLLDSTNMILVSDHGMTEISLNRTINIEELLDPYKVIYGGIKPVMMLEPQENEINDIFSILKKNENHFEVFLKPELPDFYHFNKHPFIYPIILIADIGWSLVNNEWLDGMDNSYSRGNHGYINNHKDMHGIFIANGPVFKNNYSTGTILNIDIYPMLCKIYNILPRENIDGKIDRINHILK